MEAALKRIGDVTIERVPTEKKIKNDDDEPLSSAMNSDTDFGSETHSSDDELISDHPLTSTDEKSPITSSAAHQKQTKSSENHHEPFDAITEPLLTLTSAKRKQNFDHTETTIKSSKKTKATALEHDATQHASASCSKISDIVRKSDELCDLFDDPDHLSGVKIRTRLESDNEDSEYDSEEDSDLDEPMRSELVKLEPGGSLLGSPHPDLEEGSDKADFIEKFSSELGESSQKSEDAKLDGSDYDYDITEKLKEMGEISVETVKKGEKTRKSESADGTENEISVTPAKKDQSGSDSDDKNSSERKIGNMRRNIREVMDETQLDEATLAAQRQEMERLRRVQEQQRIIREVQRQIALNRQNNKTQHRVISLLQGNSSIIKQMPGTSGSTPNRIGGTVLVKLPNGETKPMTRITKGQTPFEVVRLQKGTMQGKVQRNLIPVKKSSTGNLTPSVSIAPVAKPKIEPKTASDDSESEPSDTEKKVRKVAGKPKDVVTISSSSDDDCIVLSEDEPDEPEPDEDPCNSGMHTNDAYNVPDEQGRVLINVGHPEDEAEVFLAPQIARVIKPHQIGGVRFLFDNVIESTGRFSTSTGFGCILAHSMGLGKTLQVVCFSDIFLRHTPAKTILCIMPINTLQNWMAEYNMWLPKDTANSPLLSHGEVRPRNFNIYVLNDSHKTLTARAKVIQEWNREGGVLLIGYELYRLLSLRRNPKPKSKRKKLNAVLVDRPDTPEDDEKTKNMYDEIHEALVKPGPDLVICDEGHRIKNSHASISHALKQIRSKRRIVLTGYPLQNNLLEYWCMVDFVRPNYLGTKTEFSNMFERPIQNGQCIDSTPQDIRLMRYRAHVLHSLLEGFVQRRSHAVLQTSLPQKEEYVLLVRMTEFQRKLYDTFMNEVVRTKTVPNPLKAFAVCCKIWNHPDVLYYFLKKHTTGDAVDIDLEEVANAAALTAANGGVPVAPTPPKKASRSRGGAKKERKTAASKASNASTNSVKPAASVTPNTNTPTPSSTTTTNAPNTPIPPPNPPLNIPNPNNSLQQNIPPMIQNYPNQQPQPGPPNPNYQQPPAPYPNYQNFPQYGQNGEYYNQQQPQQQQQQQQQPNYPNNYNTGYYPNPEYGAFYDGTKPENYQQGYQHDGQNYWQQPQQNYNYQNPNQNDYYANMNQQQSGYGNQEYYRQNPYNQNYQNYQQNNPQYPPNQWQQGQQNFEKTEMKTEPVDQKSDAIKSESDPNQMQIDAKVEKKPELDSDKSEIAKQEMDDDKKSEITTDLSDIKDNLDEKADKDSDIKTEITTVSKPIKEDPGIPYDWATEFMKGYIPGCIENSAKMEIFFCILQESMALGDRILLFSQSLFTLNLIEEFLQKNDVPGTPDKWAKNKNYYRLDGSTSALEREKLINEYNSNPNIHLFLVSTRAGSLGINLVGANRVIVFDASWNPCHDTQAVCRVYRYGQKKPCFVYRIVMDNCLEKKIYDRQINKQGMADRVVDECNPDAHLSMKDVTNLCWDDEKDSEVKDFSTTKDKYIDVVMQKVLDAYSSRLSKEPFQHESLLIDRKEKKLSQAEKRLAKRSYELEKQANINSRPTYSYYNNGSGQGLQIRAIRTQDGMMQNKPVASVRPMQSEQMNLNRAAGAGQQGRSRWIPAEVWQRQGMTAQEMTLPLDVVIPTNSPDRGSIVLKAGQKVLVLKSPKGIYMQLECGKIVAIKTAFKVRGGKAPEKGEEGANKDGAPTTILKKLPQAGNNSKTGAGNLPLPLKNNSAITVIPKGGQQRVIKPFAQGVTKLNMRSIRQPVPNLISRQMNMRVAGGPRFSGKIQSIQRKVQLAKTKPYNLDKTSEASPPKPIDTSLVKPEPQDPDAETHIVPSSDEEIPAELQQGLAEKKDDDSTDNERFPPNDMFSESEKSMEPDMEPSSVEYPENSGDRRPSTESYQSSEKLSSSDSFTNLDQFSNNSEHFSTTENYRQTERFSGVDKYPERFSSIERIPNTSERFQNQSERFKPTEQTNQTERFPNQPDRFQAPEKLAYQTERFHSNEHVSNLADRASNQPERFNNPEKFLIQPVKSASQSENAERFSSQPEHFNSPEKIQKPSEHLSTQSVRLQNSEKFSSQSERFQISDKFVIQPDRFPNTEKFPTTSENLSNQPERYQNTDKFVNKSERFVSQPERFQAQEKFPNAPERFQPTENQTDGKYSTNDNYPEKYPTSERYIEKYPNAPETYTTEKFVERPTVQQKFPENQKFIEKCPNIFAERSPVVEKYSSATESYQIPEKYPKEKIQVLKIEKFPNPDRFPLAAGVTEKFPNFDRQYANIPEKYSATSERTYQQLPEKQFTSAPIERAFAHPPEKTFIGPVNPDTKYPQAPERTYPVNVDSKFQPLPERQYTQIPENKYPNSERSYPQISEKYSQPSESKFPQIPDRYPQNPDTKYQNPEKYPQSAENKYPTPEKPYQNPEVKYPENKYPSELKYSQPSETKYSTPERSFPQISETTKYPATSERQFPATSERQFPATPERQYPATPERQYPATPERQYPATPERQYPATPDRQYHVNPEKTYQPLNVPNPEKISQDRTFVQSAERSYTGTPERPIQSSEKVQPVEKYQTPERYPQQFGNKFVNPASYENIERFGSDKFQDMSESFASSDKAKTPPIKEKSVEKLEKAQKSGNFGAAQHNVESISKNRSLKNYRHNFAGQKAGNFAAKSKVTATSSALHQLEQTTVSIGENKQPFQESLDIITNSYGAVPPDGKTGEDGAHIIDLDADKPTVEQPDKPMKSGSKTSQQTTPHTITSDSNSSNSSSSKPLIQPQPSPNIKPETIPSSQPTAQTQDYGYNTYYGYNPTHNMQPYPNPPIAQPVVAAPPAATAAPIVAPPPAAAPPPPQTYYPPAEVAHYPEVKSKPEIKTVQPPVSTPSSTQSRSEAIPVTEPTAAPTHHTAGYATAPAGFAPYGSYDMMNYPQQNQYTANYPGIPYPNQPNYQPPYQAPPQYEQSPYGAPPTAANMYSAFHRPDMHQYPPADPYAQSHYAMRNAYPPQYPPYPSPAGQYAPPPGPGAGPPPPGYDYQYNAAAAAAAGFPPPPVVYPYSSLPNNNPVP